MGPVRTSRRDAWIERLGIEPSPERTLRRQRMAAIRHFERFFARRLREADEPLRAHETCRTRLEVLNTLAEGPEAVSPVWLSARLRVDPGQLCRILKWFEALGLIKMTPAVRDGRMKQVRLTPSGERTWRTLDHLDQERIGTLLDELPERLRGRLVEAMEAIEEILTRDPIANLVERVQDGER